MKDWEKWEKDVQKALQLDSTINSGNTWADPGDGVSREHYTEKKFPFIIDAKHTGHKTFSVVRKFMEVWRAKALDLGKVFILPIRFEDEHGKSDWVVLHFVDFLQLVEEAENNDNGGQSL